MTAISKLQVVELTDSINSFSSQFGELICDEVEKNSSLLLRWLQYLGAYHLTGTADSLILAVGPAVREVAAMLAVGATRPALFSLRAQIDLVLTWLYFKDHSVEWNYVNSTGDGFKMKKDLIQYLATHYESFGLRYGILKNIKIRKEEEPYRLLSAHIHGQSSVVLPNGNKLSDSIRDESECRDCVGAVFAVTEYLNDIFLSIYADRWTSLHKDIQDSLITRFISPEQRANFFKANKPSK